LSPQSFTPVALRPPFRNMSDPLPLTLRLPCEYDRAFPPPLLSQDLLAFYPFRQNGFAQTSPPTLLCAAAFWPIYKLYVPIALNSHGDPLLSPHLYKTPPTNLFPLQRPPKPELPASYFYEWETCTFLLNSFMVGLSALILCSPFVPA